MRLDEALRLHEHTARATARVVDAALERLQHLDQHAHDRTRCVELAAALTLSDRELAEEILVDAAEHVLTMVLVLEREVGEQLDDLAEPDLIGLRPGIVLGQHAFEARVFGFEQQHRLVEQLADGRLDAGSVLLDESPPRPVGHPEDVVADIKITLVDERRLLGIGERAGAPLLETVRDVFQENEAERDVFVLRSVHIAAQFVSRGPQRRLKR
jgi:hypothetical protein